MKRVFRPAIPADASLEAADRAAWANAVALGMLPEPRCRTRGCDAPPIRGGWCVGHRHSHLRQIGDVEPAAAGRCGRLLRFGRRRCRHKIMIVGARLRCQIHGWLDERP